MRLVATFFVGTLLSTLLPAQAAGWLPERQKRIDDLLVGAVAEGQVAGASYVVWHRGREVAAGAWGKADASSGRPLRRDTIVQLYSMTKPLTALAALVLVEQGKLRLDLPIRDVMPEFAAPRVFTGGTADAPETKPVQTAITVRMLLNHTAGFTYDFYRTSPVHELYRRAELWSSATTAQFVQRAAALPLLAEPGTAWNYSIADDVLGALIERVTGGTLDAFVHEHVTAPLGMTDTGFDVPPGQMGRLAKVHRRDGDTLVPTELSFGVNPVAGRGFPAGGAGAFGTLDDYLRFGRFLLGDGSLDGVRVLGRKTLDLARTSSLRGGQRTNRPADGWGLLSAVVVDPGAGDDLMSAGTLHWNGAATTSFFADVQEQLVAVLFTQHTPFDEPRLITRFRTAVYQALP